MSSSLTPLALSPPLLPPVPFPGEPVAIYVHVPFCVKKCHYCDFITGPAPETTREKYVEALALEIRNSPWRGARARTLFFGGGTPSELRTNQLAAVVTALRDTFDWGSEEAEWTIECNPATIDAAGIRAMRRLGFNRISLGVQSFHDHHLTALGRIHDADEARMAVAQARDAGFQRLNLDLIFALPGQTLAEFESDVEEALRLEPDHLSIYNLTIEPETEFGRRRARGEMDLPDEDLSADMYEWVIPRLRRAGLNQYEVSNFCLPGEECRHNQAYWWGEPYWGFGLSASSYAGGLRFTTTRSMQRYLATASRARGPERFLVEELSARAAAGELAMLGIRTGEGADFEKITARTGFDIREELGPRLEQWVEEELVVWDDRHLRLTARGLMLANVLGAELLQT